MTDDCWGRPPPIHTKDNPEYFGIHTRHQPQDFIVPEKVASDVEFKRSAQGKTTRKSSFLSYAMRGDYTLKPLDYGVHHIGVQLVELVESHLYKYLGKDRPHRKGLINLWPVSCG